MAIFAEVSENEFVEEKNPARYLVNGARLYYIIHNRMSHTGFRLVPKSVTLNDPERRNDR